MWDVVSDERGVAHVQMSRDASLGAHGLPVARFFRWDPPAVSLGWRQPPPAWMHSIAWPAAGCQRVERPSGGGVALHGSDVCVAVVVPQAWAVGLRAAMEAVCRSAAALCRSFGVEPQVLLDEPRQARITYCSMERSPYAVLVNGRKVAGFAARRYPRSWLVQGSLLVRPVPEVLQRLLPPVLQEALASRAIALSAAARVPVDEGGVLHRWASHWASWWPAGLPSGRVEPPGTLVAFGEGE